MFNSSMFDPTESQARHQIRERINRAAEPHLPHVSGRHRLAARLRRIAESLDD